MSENGFADEPIIPDVSEALAFEPVAEAPKQKSKRGRLLLVLVLLTVGVGWYFMGGTLPKSLVGGDGVPFIKADTALIKVRPEKPGGMEVPDRDKEVYEQMEGAGNGAQVERLLPPPETPLPPPTLAPAPVPAPEPAPTLAPAPASAPASPVSVAVPLTPPPPPPVPGAIQEVAKAPPVVVKKVPKKLAPKILTPPVPKTKEVLAIKPPPSAPAPPSPPKVVEAPKKKAPMAEEGATAKNTAAAPKNFYMVQLAAVRTPERAQKEWERLSNAHFELLGGLELFVTKVDLGPGKGVFYRLRAGPVADEEASRNLCNGLSARKVGCLIVYPGG